MSVDVVGLALVALAVNGLLGSRRAARAERALAALAEEVGTAGAVTAAKLMLSRRDLRRFERREGAGSLMADSHAADPSSEGAAQVAAGIGDLRAEIARLQAGADDSPATPGAWPTPGQWIAHFLALGEAERLAFAARAMEHVEAHLQCMERDHAGRIAWLEASQNMDDFEPQAFGQRIPLRPDPFLLVSDGAEVVRARVLLAVVATAGCVAVGLAAWQTWGAGL